MAARPQTWKSRKLRKRSTVAPPAAQATPWWPLRRAGLFLALLGCGYLLLAALVTVYPLARAQADARREADLRQVVERIGATDLCLSTEARYTRHPAMADRFAAFQDAPGARDPFPTGSLLDPPGPRPWEAP